MNHQVDSFLSDGAEFLSPALTQGALMHKAYQRAANPMVTTGLRNLQELAATKAAGKGGIAVARMAGHPLVGKVLRYAPGLGAIGGVMGAADVIAGPDSAGNKVMDTTAMTVGGILGAAGGPLGIAAGAGLGKMASDATQWIFGDKKTAEQRKLEEALARLNGGL